jgi:hypothetical protein
MFVNIIDKFYYISKIKMVQTHKKNKFSKKGSKHNKHQKIQHGGVSPACALPYTNDGAVYRNSTANMHNTNPQASLDLDNKFMLYGGPIPNGNGIVNSGLHGGGNKCGNEGVGTGNPKSETFKQYIDGLDSKLSISRGGGVSSDPSEMIGGLPVYKSYDDCCPPAIIGGKLVFGGPDQSLCGLGAIRGGGKKSKKNNKTKKHGKRNEEKKNKNKNNKSNKSNKSNKRNNRNNRNNNRTKTMKGGFVVDNLVSVSRSHPASFNDAFTGPMSYFKYPDDMKERNFGEVQPNYSVNAI